MIVSQVESYHPLWVLVRLNVQNAQISRHMNITTTKSFRILQIQSPIIYNIYYLHEIIKNPEIDFFIFSYSKISYQHPRQKAVRAPTTLFFVCIKNCFTTISKIETLRNGCETWDYIGSECHTSQFLLVQNYMIKHSIGARVESM